MITYATTAFRRTRQTIMRIIRQPQPHFVQSLFYLSLDSLRQKGKARVEIWRMNACRRPRARPGIRGFTTRPRPSAMSRLARSIFALNSSVNSNSSSSMLSSQSRNASCSALDNCFTSASIFSSVCMMELNPQFVALQRLHSVSGEHDAGNRNLVAHFQRADFLRETNFAMILHFMPD